MKKWFSLILVMALCCWDLFGCGPTPNNIVMTVNRGQCLTGGVDGAPTNNPITAQYCMSVTLQNNNSGENANNVEVTNSGLTLGYTALTNSGYQTYSNVICDSNASVGVCPSGTNQIGNITIYDPNNCATQQGSQVTTLMANGGTCTFYLQISAESFALGSYPIGISYNYTNSNQNFNISTTIYQNVTLYAGGNSGLYLLNGSELQLTKSATNTTVAIHDNYGNLYFNNGNTIYKYNGLTYTQLSGTLPSGITSLTIDNNANLIVGTLSNGLYYYNVNSGVSWQSLTDSNNQISSSTQILGVLYTLATNNIIYVMGITNNSYTCIESGTTTPTISCVGNTNGPTQFYTNAIASYNGVLYAGIIGGVESYVSEWGSYTFVPLIFSGGYGASLVANSYGLFVGINSASAYSESSLYNCVWGSSSCALESSGVGNYIMGNLNGIAVDGAGYVYGVGNNINSIDFVGATNTYGFFESGVSNTTTTWQPITNSSVESFNAPVVVSSLVN